MNPTRTAARRHRSAVAQRLGFDGPPLGAKLADANAREFSAEQQQKGAAATTFLGQGSHGHASQAGMFDTSKNIVKSNRVAASTAELSMMGQGSAGCALCGFAPPCYHGCVRVSTIE